MLGFFSLATKEIRIDADSISKSLFKRLAASNTEPTKTFLIGQLGKNSAIQSNPCNLPVILEEAFNKIEDARDVVGGRAVILECENEQSLIQLYERNGFKKLQQDEDSLVTMYAILQ